MKQFLEHCDPNLGKHDPTDRRRNSVVMDKYMKQFRNHLVEDYHEIVELMGHIFYFKLDLYYLLLLLMKSIDIY